MKNDSYFPAILTALVLSCNSTADEAHPMVTVEVGDMSDNVDVPWKDAFTDAGRGLPDATEDVVISDAADVELTQDTNQIPTGCLVEGGPPPPEPGLAVPQPVLDELDAPSSFALLGTQIFVTTRTAIVASSTDGSGVPTEIVSAVNEPNLVRIGMGRLVWLDRDPSLPMLANNIIRSYSFDSGDVETIGSLPAAVSDLAVYDDTIYWAGGSPHGQIGMLSQTVGATSTILVNGADNPHGLARNVGTLFFSTYTLQMDKPGAVFSVPIVGGVPTQHAVTSGLPTRVAATDMHLAWTELQATGDGGTVSWQVRATGQTGPVLNTAKGPPLLMVLDGEDMFWVQWETSIFETSGGGFTAPNVWDSGVRHALVGDVKDEVLATGLLTPTELILGDDSYLYWLERGTYCVRPDNLVPQPDNQDGVIRRIPRP